MECDSDCWFPCTRKYHPEKMLVDYEFERGRRRLAGGIPMCNKTLVAVDFDHTLIDANSDTYIAKLAPGEKFPEELRKRYSPGSWTIFMRAVFRYLYQWGVSPEELLDCIAEIPLIKGTREWFQALNESGQYEVVVISDANTVFIEHILYVQEVRHLVHEVFSNYAQFDANGCLTIQEFHHNDQCKICEVNLCKSRVVSDYIDRRKKQGVNLQKVVYIGDGNNDFCPAVNCKRGDLVLARKDFPLSKKLDERPITAKVQKWSDGFEIYRHIQQHFSQETSSGTVSPSSD